MQAETSRTASSAAPFFSPVYRFDPVAKLSILSFRDANSGAIVQQIPNAKVVEQYRRSGGANPNVPAAVKTTALERPADEAVKTPVVATAADAKGPVSTPSPAVTPSAAPVTAAPEPAPEPAAAQTTAPASAPEVQRVSLSV